MESNPLSQQPRRKTEFKKLISNLKMFTMLNLVLVINFIIHFVESKTSLISKFPPKLYIYEGDKLAFQTSNLVNSSMASTQMYPSPTIQKDKAEHKVHDFMFLMTHSAAHNCIKTVSSNALEFAFICHSRAHVFKKLDQGDNWINGDNIPAPFIHAPTMIVLQRLRTRKTQCKITQNYSNITDFNFIQPH